jgi:hypothetical protein
MEDEQVRIDIHRTRTYTVTFCINKYHSVLLWTIPCRSRAMHACLNRISFHRCAQLYSCPSTPSIPLSIALGSAEGYVNMGVPLEMAAPRTSPVM